MIMTLDVGNTTMHGGIFEDGKLILQFRKATTINTSSDEIGIFLRSVLKENEINYKEIKDIACCSVVPQINHSLSNAMMKYFSVDPLFIQAGIKTGLKLRYANPKEIGADRIAAAIGASAIHPSMNLIVIDMGTATTIDIVTDKAEYTGGAILPGLKMCVEGLTNGTAQLPSVEIVKPKKLCGNNTIEVIQSGIYYGNAGAIKELCRLYKNELFPDQNVYTIGTGGFSRIFEDYGIFDEIVPELVLIGIKKALEMNS